MSAYGANNSDRQMVVIAQEDIFEARLESMGAAGLLPLHREALDEIHKIVSELDHQRAKPVFDALAELAVRSFKLGKEVQRTNSFTEIEEGWYD